MCGCGGSFTKEKKMGKAQMTEALGALGIDQPAMPPCERTVAHMLADWGLDDDGFEALWNDEDDFEVLDQQQLYDLEVVNF